MKKLLHWISLLTLCLVLIFLLPQQTNAAGESDLTFTFQSDSDSYYVTDCNESATGELVIPSAYNGKPVTGIGSSALDNCTGLTGVTIPDSIIFIGWKAFDGCTGLKNVYITDPIAWCKINFGFEDFVVYSDEIEWTVNYQYDYTASPMYYAEQLHILDEQGNVLTNVELGYVKSIPAYAFKNCSSLISVNAKTYGKNALSGCSNLKSMTIYSVSVHKEYTFESEISTGKGMMSDYSYWEYPFERAFGEAPYDDSIEVVRNTVYRYKAHIADSFDRWKATSHTYYLPESLSEIIWLGSAIPDGAFKDWANINKISISAEVTSVGNSAFSNCSSLYEVYFDGTKEQWNTISIGSKNAPLRDAELHTLDGISGFCGKELSWMLDHNGVLRISGTGEMKNYGEGTAPWYVYRASVENVVVESGVTSIGEYAFYWCSNVTTITISDTVTSIGKGAFESCESLKSVYIPHSVVSIENGAFAFCTALTQITICNGVQSVGEFAFYACDKLGEIQIPESVTAIGAEAFSGCSSLTAIWVDEKNSMYTSDENGVLFDKAKTQLLRAPCSLADNYVIPESVTKIQGYAFENCGDLVSIDLSSNIIEIGNSAFSNCKNLIEFTIPEGVTGIGDYTFRGCSKLAEITIPRRVIAIGYYAFHGCSALTSVYYESTQNRWNGLIIDDGNEELQAATLYFGKITEEIASLFYEFTDGKVTIIGCDALTGGNFVIPATIDDCPVTAIGEAAFANCTNLTGIVIPESVVSIGDSAFDDCGNLSAVEIKGSINYLGKYSFRNCIRLSKVSIAGGTAEIGTGAFTSCRSLKKITLPNGIKGIGDYAFDGCKNLVSVELPDSITYIGKCAFYNCKNLPSLTIPDSVTAIGAFALSGCSGLESMTIPFVGASLESALANRNEYPLGYLFGTSSYEGSIAITQTYYGKDMYGTCYFPSGLRSVTVSGGNIFDFAFDNCNTLVSITLGTGVQRIYDYAFKGCTNLRNLAISDSVISIGEEVFYNCPSLVYNTYDNAMYLGDAANPYVVLIKATSENITTCQVYEKAKVIYKDAFAHCANLKDITIAGTMTQISLDAFNGCNSLENVYFDGIRQQWNSIVFAEGNLQLTNANIIFNAAYLLQYEIKNGIAMVVGCDTAATGRLVIPATYEGYPVTKIGNYAFYNCRELTVVVIPDSVESIGNAAFGWCQSLTQITVPDSVESIGYSAFCNCFSLRSFRVPANLKKISNSMLEGCSRLKEVILPAGLQSIGYYAFSGCESLQSVSIPTGVTSIQNSAFAKCYSLTSVTIPSGVSVIDYSVFEACQSLEIVRLPETITEINMYAFDGCTALKNVYFNGNRSKWMGVSVGNHNSALFTAQLFCNPVTVVTEDALVVTEDGVASTVLVECGQVLDLNGCVLTVESMASFGQIIDSVGGGGLIVENLEISGNDWLPIQDESGCYRFYAYEVQNLGTKENAHSVSFGFALRFEDVAAYGDLLKTGDAQVGVTLAWGEHVKTFVFSKELIGKYVALVEKYPALRPYLKLEVTGLDSLPTGTKLLVIPTLTAANGKLQNAASGMEYIA